MAKAALIVFAAVTALAALRRVWRALVRRRGTAVVPPGAARRTARAVRLRVHPFGNQVFLGISPRRSTRTNADLVIGADRFVLSSERGVLLDVGPAHGRRLGSVRCTGPGRLVIEGDLPKPDGTRANWRLELAIEDAEGWARDLAPFVAR